MRGKKVLLLLLAVLLACGAVSCREKKQEEADTSRLPQAMDLSALVITEYVELGEYRDMEFSLSAAASRGEAVWQAVLENSRVLAYPEEQVAYYVAQEQAKYRYYAKQKGATYEEILEANGVSEEAILQEAQELTKKDLVFYAVLAAEQITLSVEEKQTHFDRYAEKFIQDYGYSAEYVQSHLTEEIYSTMLYDKMIEKLITLNTFTVTEE